MSPSQPLVLPARPDLAVALVYLHAQAGPDFFADIPFAWTAGELRALGIPADVLHVHFERDRPDLGRRLCDELIAALRSGGYGLVVFDQCWMPELFSRVRAETGARVCETEPGAVHPGIRVDFVLHHFTEHRQPLIDLCLCLRDGEDLRGLRNLRVDLGDGRSFAVQRFETHPEVPDARRPFCPVTECITLGEPIDEQGRAPPVRKTLDTNKGCPFSAPVRANPAFAGVPLDEPGIRSAGCSFCPMGGDYRPLPWRETVAVHLEQIAYYRRRLPELAEIVLRDQHALRYLPELLEGALDRGLRPFGLLVPGRGDAILRFSEPMERAAAIASGTGLWFTIYLIGFESFSQAQLDLYNKSVPVERYAEAIAALRALHRRHPDSFALHRAGGGSFILWNPWTTLDDLRTNVDFCADHGLGRLARGLTTTRLRLYPHLPLYHKARAEGLLVDAPPTAGRGAEHTGYAAEAAWRYRDPRVEAVEELHERLRRHCAEDELVGLLDTCERHVRAGAGPGPDELEAVEAGWRRLRSLWRRDAVPATALDAEQRRRRAGGIAARADRTVLAGRHCNNRCRTCVAGHAEHEQDLERLLRTIREAAALPERRVTLAGREPTLLPFLVALLRAARQAGAEQVELVSNGRVLANPGAAGRLARAGATDLLLKRHRMADADEDAFARSGGAGAELWRGVSRLGREAPGLRWRMLLIATREALRGRELARLVERAAERGAAGVQLRVPAAEVEPETLGPAFGALREALRAACRAGLHAAIEGF